MEVEHKAYKASVQSAGDQGELTALVSCYSIDRSNEKVLPGAFKQSLERKLPKLCWAHDWTKPIGKTVAAYETDQGLVVKAKLNLATTIGKEAYAHLKAGDLDEWSIGYSVVKDSRDKKGVRNLEILDLHEVSAVLVGMNRDTRTLELKHAANANKESVMSAEVAEVDYKSEIESLRSTVEALTKERNKPLRPNFGGNPMGQRPEVEQKSIGEMFTESAAFKNYKPSTGAESEAVTFNISVKTLMTTSAGYPPEVTRSGLVVPYIARPIQVVDVIPRQATTQTDFRYLEETTLTNNMAEVAEGGLKPEVALALTERSVAIRKIAGWLPMTDEQIEDSPGVSDYVNNRLAYMAAARLDQQLISGDGIAPNLLGMLNVVGIQEQPKGTDAVTDAIRKAKTKVRVIGGGQANAVLINPNDWETVQLLRTTDGIYISGGPWNEGPDKAWSLPVIESEAVPEGVAIVGDFRYTLLLDRKEFTIKVGYSGDDWLRNRRSVIGELRCGFAVLRPQAIVKVTGI